MSEDLRVGIVGFGKIARDQHVPAIAGTDGIELVAVADPSPQAESFGHYPSIEAMLAGEPKLDAAILCQPPQLRFAAARAAITAGKHVFLEKPPGSALSEVEALTALAGEKGVTLFTSWHSREAAAVQRAKRWLSNAAIGAVRITWKEDVRVWHPGQDWIWEPGGFGVFDPGINALSILTEILPEPVRVVAAMLEFPSNRAAPIAAKLEMETASGIPIGAEFDFRQTGPQSWDILVEAVSGDLLLSQGGNALAIDGVAQDVGEEREYPALYRRFLSLTRERKSDVDLAPLRLVTDAFLVGCNRESGPFLD